MIYEDLNEDKNIHIETVSTCAHTESIHFQTDDGKTNA